MKQAPSRAGSSSGDDEAGIIERRGQDVARMLRALVEANEARSILVVGVDRGVRGLAARLAGAMARAGRVTILVDADLRGMDGFEAIDGRPAVGGLAGWLLNPMPIEGDLPSLEPSEVPNLSFVRRGSKAIDAADALDGPRLDDLLPALLRRADRVVVAGSHLSANADSLPFARRVDQVLLSVSTGRTRRDAAIKARDAIQVAGGQIAGVVMDT